MARHWKEILIILAIGFAFLLWKNNQVLRADKARLGSNQQTLLSEVEYLRLKDSTMAATVGALQLSIDEFQQSSSRQFDGMKDIMGELSIKIRNVKSMSSAETVTTNEINTFFKDSTLLDKRIINYLDTVTPFYTVKIIHYPWSNALSMKIIYRDKMTQIVYWEKKGILFWRKKKLRQVIHFDNPDTQIRYPQYIEITKNNKQ